MKILYTEMENNITNMLIDELKKALNTKKTIFYLTKHNLTFEKTKYILEKIGEGEEIAVTKVKVTSFEHLTRYLPKIDNSVNQNIDDNAYRLLFHKVLKNIKPEELSIYSPKDDSDFVMDLVHLYKELQESGLTIADVYNSDLDSRKIQDLMLIFDRFEKIVIENSFQNKSQLSLLTEQLEQGKFKSFFEDSFLIIDNFSNFTGEELAFLRQVNQYCLDITLGLYCSEKALKAPYSVGNVYQMTVDLINNVLTPMFNPQIVHKKGTSLDETNSLAHLSRKFESFHDLQSVKKELTPLKKVSNLELWEATNTKEEIEHVAKQIRQDIANGFNQKDKKYRLRYKDILVLVGDDDRYSLEIKRIFNQYDIPYYLDQTEKMYDNPIITVLDSLYRLKKYNFRTEDISSLLQTGLFGDYNQDDYDYFDRYIRYAKIKGKKSLTEPFTKGEQYRLEELNKLRKELFGLQSSLQFFFEKRRQNTDRLLDFFTLFLHNSKIIDNFVMSCNEQSEVKKEQFEEVWKTFKGILEAIHTIFSGEKMDVLSLLDYIRTALLTETYRTVPATVDTVSIKSYQIEEPHKAKVVYAIGMSKVNFPKLKENTSLLSDQERVAINDGNKSNKKLAVVTHENQKRNLYYAMTLLHIASDKLVISYSQTNDSDNHTMSPYMEELLVLSGNSLISKGAIQLEDTLEHIGNARSLLTTVTRVNQLALGGELSNFWQVMTNRAIQWIERKEPGFTQRNIKTSEDEAIKTKWLSPEVTNILYSDKISQSSSALDLYYTCDYKYFLTKQLSLHEVDTIEPDSRIHGQYMHEVLERYLNGGKTIDEAIKEVSEKYNQYYTYNAQYQFSKLILDSIVKEMSTTNALNSSDSHYFEYPFQYSIESKETHPIVVGGRIDRIDQSDSEKKIAIIDYKSGNVTFDFRKFYNGLSSQLVTYLAGVKRSSDFSSFSAIIPQYLHLVNPVLPFSEVSDSGYQAYFTFNRMEKPVSEKARKKVSFEPSDIDKLLDFSDHLYQKASQKIVSGEIKINPYTKDYKTSLGCERCPFKSICRFESNQHMKAARPLEEMTVVEFLESRENHND